MYQRGDAYAAEASERVAEVLLPMQDADGSWKPSAGSETNRIYRTAMALLSLSVKYHYLPIYQR
jgi:squalene cyclase